MPSGPAEPANEVGAVDRQAATGGWGQGLPLEAQVGTRVAHGRVEAGVLKTHAR
jgi:hypothetical protein